jgi:hypothetical protein
MIWFKICRSVKCFLRGVLLVGWYPIIEAFILFDFEEWELCLGRISLSYRVLPLK